MRTLAFLGALALLLGAQSAVAGPSADQSGTGDDSATASPTGDSATASPTHDADNNPSASDSDKSSSGSADKAGKDAGKKPAAPTYGHGRQFSLRAGIVGGYNMDFRYDRSPFCVKPNPKKAAKDQQKFCGHEAPFGVDLGLGFAPLDSLELFLWGRFGFTREAETDTNPLVLVGAGARLYTMSDSAFKVFIEPAIALELESGGTTENWQSKYLGYNPSYKQDIVFHVAAGPQYDFAKNVGVYLDAGLTVGILRSIHSEMELTGGVQARLP